MDIGVHGMGVSSEEAASGGNIKGEQLLFQRKAIFNVAWLSAGDGLQVCVNPFANGLEETTGARHNGACLESGLVDLHGEIEGWEWFLVGSEVVADVSLGLWFEMLPMVVNPLP